MTGWDGWLRNHPECAEVVQEFEVLLDSFAVSAMDHIDHDESPEVRARELADIRKDVEGRRKLFRRAMVRMGHNGRKAGGKGPEAERERGNKHGVSTE